MSGGLGGNEHEETRRLKEVFPKRMRQALELRGLSRRALSEAIGVHLNTVHAYASGNRLPRISQLTLLAEALKVSIEWLVEFENVEVDIDIAAGHKPDPTERDIIYYVAIENGRGYSPTKKEVGQACELDWLRLDAHINRLVSLDYANIADEERISLTEQGTGLFKEMDDEFV